MRFTTSSARSVTFPGNFYHYTEPFLVKIMVRLPERRVQSTLRVLVVREQTLSIKLSNQTLRNTETKYRASKHHESFAFNSRFPKFNSSCSGIRAEASNGKEELSVWKVYKK